jgi:hypothetical protein
MELKKTITSIFIVPTFKIDREKLKSHGFINGYIKDETAKVDYENCAYILLRPKDMMQFKTFLDDEYERTKAIIDDYDYEGGFVVLVYEMNSKFKKDFDLVKEGLYSKTSKAFQEIFPKIARVNIKGSVREEVSLQRRIFEKTEDLRKYWEEKIGVDFDDEMEVWEGFIWERETLNINKIKENYVQPENSK